MCIGMEGWWVVSQIVSQASLPGRMRNWVASLQLGINIDGFLATWVSGVARKLSSAIWIWKTAEEAHFEV